MSDVRTAWQTVQVARHPERPLFLDYVNHLFTEFDPLHGDRLYGEDGALLGGLARFQGRPVVVIGQHKGRSTRERIAHNFGMPNPEGYRKALRLFGLAERFGLPVLTFLDTQGAYPGREAEERGQAIAIAENLARLSVLKVPVIEVHLSNIHRREPYRNHSYVSKAATGIVTMRRGRRDR